MTDFLAAVTPMWAWLLALALAVLLAWIAEAIIRHDAQIAALLDHPTYREADALWESCEWANEGRRAYLTDLGGGWVRIDRTDISDLDAGVPTDWSEAS